MTRSATDVMQDVIVATVLDSFAALKTASKGLPNNLLRDLNAIHANTTFADLPSELQASINASVRAAFTRLLKEGYSVSSGQAATPPRNPIRRDGPPNHRGPRPGGPRGERRDGPRPPRKGGRPGGKPGPRGK